MPNEIKPFRGEYLEEAGRLFAERIKIERTSSPLLPPRFDDPSAVLPLLEGLAAKSAGVAAIDNGKLVGFMIGRPLPSWRGRRSVWVPEWAHAEAGEVRAKVFNDMYENVAWEWVRNGCYTHLVSTLAHDEGIVVALFWLGFGLAAVDAMRDLGDVEGPLADVDIRRADGDDVDIVLPLEHAQERYMATSPIFMPLVELSNKGECRASLSDPRVATWVASDHGKAVSRMRIGPASEDAAFIITDERTASITAAFTEEAVRAQGISAALLRRSLAWAKAEGYVRCAVDFEPENVLGRSFWLKHFRPVSYSLIRQLDPRIARAYEGRGGAHAR